MAEAILSVLGYAAGIAVSPVPVAAVILMLLSERARRNCTSFAAAWVLGVAGVTTVVLWLPGVQAGGPSPSPTEGWTRLTIGVVLLAAAVREWRLRPDPGEQPRPPRWMDRVQALRPPAAFGLGLVLSVLNPKNTVLAATAGATISAADVGGAEAAGTVVVFTGVAAASVVVPVAAYLVASRRFEGPLDTAKDALLRHNRTVLAVVLAVIGAVFGVQGTAILAA